MAMSETEMTDAVYNEMALAYWPDAPLPPDAEMETKKYYKAVFKAIIDYIKKNAEIVDGKIN
jgi:hypothetical protein